MGRAIDMEKDICELKTKVEKLDNIVRGMTHTIDELSEKATKTKHIDLVGSVKKEEGSNGKKKANDKGSSKSGRNAKTSNGSSKDKNNKSGNSSK